MKDLTILLGEGVHELARFRRVRLAASPRTRDAKFAGDGVDRFAGSDALGDNLPRALGQRPTPLGRPRRRGVGVKGTWVVLIRASCIPGSRHHGV